MLKVNKRNGFSDRNKINPVNTEIQLYEFDERTRIRLNNLMMQIYKSAFEGYNIFDPVPQGFLHFVMDEIYVQPVSCGGVYDEGKILSFLEETILKDTYNFVLDVVEAIAQYMDRLLENAWGQRYRYEIGCTKVFHKLNYFFETEYVGYRFIGNTISPISDSIEVQEISTTLKNPFEPVRDHISKANRLLSDRENPDYENSIKESISAVEAICQELLTTSGRKAVLGQLLKELKDHGIIINPTLESAFQTLYSYTSGAKGIRHAGDIGGPSSTFEEAKFMLVSCSAFINYLMGVSAKL